MITSLGPEFLAWLVNSAKEQLTDSTVRAENEVNPLDAGAPDTTSFQDQINAMNKNGASSILVAPFNEVEVTGVRQNPYSQSLTHAMACPGLNAVLPKGGFEVIMQWCAAHVGSGVPLRYTPPHFGDQSSPGYMSQPEMNRNGLLGLHQHTGAFEDGPQSPQELLQGGLLHPPATSPNGQASFMNRSWSPGSGLLLPPSGTSSLHWPICSVTMLSTVYIMFLSYYVSTYTWHSTFTFASLS